MEWINVENFNKRASSEKLQPVWTAMETINQSTIGQLHRKQLETESNKNNNNNNNNQWRTTTTNDIATIVVTSSTPTPTTPTTPRKAKVTKVTKLILKSPPKVNVVRVKSVQTFKKEQHQHQHQSPGSPSFTRSVLTNDTSPRKEKPKKKTEHLYENVEKFSDLRIEVIPPLNNTNENKLKIDFQKNKEDREKVTEDFKEFLAENLISSDFGSPRNSQFSSIALVPLSFEQNENIISVPVETTNLINNNNNNTLKREDTQTDDVYVKPPLPVNKIQSYTVIPASTSDDVINVKKCEKIVSNIVNVIKNQSFPQSQRNEKIIRDRSNPIIQRTQTSIIPSTSKSSAMNSMPKTPNTKTRVPSSSPPISSTLKVTQSSSVTTISPKHKTYDPKKAREFIKEQKIKRKISITNTKDVGKNEKEEIKKRLSELRLTTLKLAKKCQNKGKKSMKSELKLVSSDRKTITPKSSSNRRPTKDEIKKSLEKLDNQTEKLPSTVSLKPVVENVDVRPISAANEITVDHKILHLNSQLLCDLNKIGILRRPENDFIENERQQVLTTKPTLPELPVRSSVNSYLNSEVNKENIEIKFKSSSTITQPQNESKSSSDNAIIIDHHSDIPIKKNPNVKVKTQTTPMKEDNLRHTPAPANNNKNIPFDHQTNKPNIPFWLRPSIAQIYPYNFVTAVRKKLEAITNPTQKSILDCEESNNNNIQTIENHQTPDDFMRTFESPQKHYLNEKNDQLLKEIQNIPTINKYFSAAAETVMQPPQLSLSDNNNSSEQSKRTSNSEMNTNFSSISLHVAESNTISEVSSIKSESIRNNIPFLCSTKINNVNNEIETNENYSDHDTNSGRTTICTSFSSVQPPLSQEHDSGGSPEKNKTNFQIDILSKLDDSGTNSQISLLSLDNSENQLNNNKLKTPQWKMNTKLGTKKREDSGSGSDDRFKSLNPYEKDLECQKLLDDFNKSLNKVIQVQHKLYSVFKKPTTTTKQPATELNSGKKNSVEQHQLKNVLNVKTQITQTVSSTPYVNFNTTSFNYSEDFEKILESETNQPSNTIESSSSKLEEEEEEVIEEVDEELEYEQNYSEQFDESEIPIVPVIEQVHNNNEKNVQSSVLNQKNKTTMMTTTTSTTTNNTRSKTSRSSSIQTQFSDCTVRQTKQKTNSLLQLTRQNFDYDSVKIDSGYKKKEVTSEESTDQKNHPDDDDIDENRRTNAKRSDLMNASLGSEIFAVFNNQSDIEMSIVSATHLSETNLSYSTIGMYEQLIQTETNKSDHLASLMKLREKTLIDRTKGQIAWLELQKQKYKEKGRIVEMSAIKKKQRAILMRLEKERAEILKVLKHQKYNPKRYNIQLKPDDLLNHSAVSIRKSMKVLNSTRTNNEAMRAYEMEGGINLEELLMKRETELKRRKENVERLVQWHQRLDKEEQEVKYMEQMLIKFNLHKYENVTTTTTMNNNLSIELELKKQKQVRKIDKSLKILQNISSTTTLDKTVEDCVSASGRQMNKLWIRLTGRTNDTKFNGMKRYQFNKKDLEDLYEEAKKVVLGEFNEAMNDLLEESKREGEDEEEAEEKESLIKEDDDDVVSNVELEISRSSSSTSLSVKQIEKKTEEEVNSILTTAIEHSESNFNSDRSSENVPIISTTEELTPDLLEKNSENVKITTDDEIELNLNLDFQTDSQESGTNNNLDDHVIADDVVEEESGYYFDNDTVKNSSIDDDEIEEIEEIPDIHSNSEKSYQNEFTDVNENEISSHSNTFNDKIEKEEEEEVNVLKKMVIEEKLDEEVKETDVQKKMEEKVEEAEIVEDDLEEVEEEEKTELSESPIDEEISVVLEIIPEVPRSGESTITSGNSEIDIKSLTPDEDSFHIKEMFDKLSESSNQLIEDMSFPNFDNYNDTINNVTDDKLDEIKIITDIDDDCSDGGGIIVENINNISDDSDVNKTQSNVIDSDSNSKILSEKIETSVRLPSSQIIETNDIEERLIILDESLKDVNQSFENLPIELKSPTSSSRSSPRSSPTKSDFSSDWNKSVETEVKEISDKTFSVEIHEEEECSVEEVEEENSSKSEPIKIEIKLKNQDNIKEPVAVVPGTSSVPTISTDLTRANRMPDVINEAERQHMQIEQEIKQIDQIVILREFPNKPPPPYIPPSSDSQFAAVFPSKERLIEIVIRRTKELYEEEFLENDKENVPTTASNSVSILNENITNIYERIVLDICRESFVDLKIPDIKVSFKQMPTYKKQLAFYNPPNRLEAIQKHIFKRVNKLLSVENRGVRPQTGGVQSSGNSRKRDLVDEILAEELMEEESKWTNFDFEEIQMKNQVTDEIMKLLMGEALKDMELAYNIKHNVT